MVELDWDIVDIVRVRFKQVDRKPFALGPKNQAVAGLIVGLGVVLRAVRTEVDFPNLGTFSHKVSKVWKTLDVDGVPVVETCAFDQFVGQLKTERFDEIEGGSGCGAEPGDIAGVLRYIRLDQHDVERRVGPVEWELSSGAWFHIGAV